ncbi:hypothetical protein [Hymenobacter arizonensis]|uniref:Uncharacterized protein n=1 Tax=Hymenobacter arizonensis TaxID=1227077 RepID=A0A1I6BEK0_HYMAR|nr:hypothetical protein [Hymenobacter arizonensis]SFQ79395.1 hypothetical protein SAMN04515668_4436 [Hymenobacter arizonensis]
MLTDWLTHPRQATIIQAQTTYVRVAVAPTNAPFRLDFRAKKEARLKPGAHGAITHHTTHPLLLDHNEPAVQLFLTSRPHDPQALGAAIVHCVDAFSQGWRDVPHYLCRWHRFQAVARVQQTLQEGSGVLLYHAPASLAKAVIGVCQQHGVATKHFGDPDGVLARPDPPSSVVLIGSNYVIAEHFLVRAL